MNELSKAEFFGLLTEPSQQVTNHQLHTVAEDCGYILTDHHHALADAEACAEIAMQLL